VTLAAAKPILISGDDSVGGVEVKDLMSRNEVWKGLRFN